MGKSVKHIIAFGPEVAWPKKNRRSVACSPKYNTIFAEKALAPELFPGPPIEPLNGAKKDPGAF